MAEQEACTELVKQASQDQSSQSIDGESLLLPLLQGLLDVPDNEQTQDSGTESGEDQRSGLISEVQIALDKLSMNLLSDATDITPERRSSLLQLVNKLQAGLSSATSDRRHSGQIRFSRRRERPDRHTIGVSNEELADARKLIEEISCPSQSSSKTSLIPKQNSEGSVNKTMSFNPTNQKSSVKNSTPKPFSCSNSATASSNSSSVQTPSESVDCISYLFNESAKDCHSAETSPTSCLNQSDDTYKQSSQVHYVSTKETEFEPNNIRDHKNNIGDSEDESSTIKSDNNTKPDIMQNNPIYHQPKREEYADNNKGNRYISKKQKMRRANTIDIPKPLHFYELDDEEETDAEEEERKRRSNYLALRGPIRVGNTAIRNSIPTLEPKTENDKKFLAFISKHNQKNQRHSLWASKIDQSSIWNNKFDNIKTNFEKRTENEHFYPKPERNFVKASDDSVSFTSKRYDPKISKQSAMNLKRMFEEKQRMSNERRNSITTENSFNPTSDKSARFIPKPLPVNKFSHAPSSAFQPVARTLNDKTQHSPFRPIQDKETHDDRPEERLEITKSVLEIQNNQGQNRLFLYSPKPLNRENVSPTSPGFSKPWMANTGESRVLTLAAKKFENLPSQSINSFQPRRLSREKINAFPNFQNNNDRMAAPYLVKSLEQPSHTVRKLSGQYNNLGYQYNKPENLPQHHVFPKKKNPVEGFQPKFTVPQNYSIRYDKPNIPPQPIPKIYNPTPGDVKKYNKNLHSENQSTRIYHVPTDDQKVSRPFRSEPDVSYRQNKPDLPDLFRERPLNVHHRTIAKKEYDNKDNDDGESQKPDIKYEVQTTVKTEVYENPRIEISQDDYQNEKFRPNYLTQSSVESMKEYEGISSRVMTGPVVQVASTVKQKSPMSRNEHDMQAAFDLKTALQKASNTPSPNPQFVNDTEISREIPKKYQGTRFHISQDNNVIYNNTQPNNYSQDSRLSERTRVSNRTSVSESHEMNARGEHIITGKLPLRPSINVQPPPNKPTQANILSKSDSWHQICLLNQGTPPPKPSPRSSTNTRNITKSKSTHSMIPPKQYEAGMTKDEIAEKRRTMEAFFGGGGSPQQQSKSPSPGKVIKRSINRTKTSEKNVQYKHIQTPEMPLGLARSRTLPDIVSVDLLDESNVDQAFEDLFTSS